MAESVRGVGPVVDVGCGPGYVTGHLHDLGELLIRPDEDVPGDVIFARGRS